MIKTLGIVLGGLFVGAVVVEVVRKKYPNALDNLYQKTSDAVSEAKEAFKTGYAQASRPVAAAA